MGRAKGKANASTSATRRGESFEAVATESKTYTELRIDTTRYVGNFQREAAAYIFGAQEYDITDGKRILEIAHAEDTDPFAGLKEVWDEEAGDGALTDLHYGSDSWTEFSGIDSTPAEILASRPEDEQRQEMGTTLVFTFKRALADAEIEAITKRVQRFPAAYLQSISGWQRTSESKIEILGVRMRTITEIRSQSQDRQIALSN
jgi:hypothetical protein